MEEEGEGGEREGGKATVLGGREEREEGVKGQGGRKGGGRGRAPYQNFPSPHLKEAG